MRMLRTQRPTVIGMEEMYNLEAAIPHVRYIRDLLRFVGAQERDRFNKPGWASGDPSCMGGDALEVYTYQLGSLLYTLFGGWSEGMASSDRPGGDRLSAEVHALSLVEPENAEELTGQLVRADGGAGVLAESIQSMGDSRQAPHLRTLADRFATEHGRANTPPANTPGLGKAHVGLANLNRLRYRLQRTTLDEQEEAILVEIIGATEHIDRLEDLILRGVGEGEAPLLYRWRTDSEATSARGGTQSLVMVLAEDLFDLNFAMTGVVFARLLAAWIQERR